MSQNFELLSQLEAEFHLAGAKPKAVPKTETARTVERIDDTAFSQELLALAQSVFLSGGANAPSAVVLCGIDRESASTDICVKLGHILAAYSTRPVCLVDAHLRSPRLEKVLRADQPPSFTDRTQDYCREMDSNLWLADVDMASSKKQADVAPALGVKQQLDELRRRFDFVLIDTPGINTGAEVAVLGQFVDGVILIVEANVTRKAAALKARRTLEGIKVRILGSVLNNRTFPIPERLYRKL